MSFTEANAVEYFIRDLLCGRPGAPTRLVREASAPYDTPAIALPAAGLGWDYVPPDQLPRTTDQVLVEPHLRGALIRLNPTIAAHPDRADEVLYRLRAILLSVRADGLVRANEEFTAWLHGERSMPFGPNNEHVTIRLIDFDTLGNNRFVVTTQYTYRAGVEHRPDLVLLVNGIPLAIGEAKSPARPAITWLDGASQLHDDYEPNIPMLFVPNVLSFATEGKTFRYGAIRMPLELWAPWRAGDDAPPVGGLAEVRDAVRGLLRPEVLLDILANFTLFATDKARRKIKVICRYQQYAAANRLVDRVVAGRVRKGLIWHFQGSGKSLLMVFAAQKLRRHPALQNPTVLIVVDCIDLDTQLTATFNAADVPNLVTTDSRAELHDLLARDTRKVIITTIHKFAEAPGVLNARSNIVVLVDEAHRTQEGDLGRKMREALPNAFLFGLTGTPINTRDRNTFWAFGAEEDSGGYLSRYSLDESIRDGATLPLHFEPRLVDLRIDRTALDEAFAHLTGDLTEDDQAQLSHQAARLAVLLKSPDRIRQVVDDIVAHFQAKVEPNGFKAQVVTFDRESCVLYKEAFDRLLPPEASTVVMTVGQHAPAKWKAQYRRDRDEEEKLLERFRDPADPLKVLIVTAKLLTGFDAPILQAMYLDKPMKDHTLLQGICRVNRPYPNKSHGLIVDYLGIFDDVARALDFDEGQVRRVISNLDELKLVLPAALDACLAYFPGVDRTVSGYEGLIAAQEHLPDNETRDAFAADYSYLARHWEALSPDPILGQYEADYRWLTQVYESVQPPSGVGKLLWHALGAKTIALIHEHVHVESVRDDLDTLVLDAELVEELTTTPDPSKAKELEVKIVRRLQQHRGDPKFVQLSERLERLREQFARGVANSLLYLKQLLELARDVLQAEKEADPISEEDRAKAALTDLFESIKTPDTPIIVERIVADIDAIVRVVRFPGWQGTHAGEREVKQALRRTLLKYKLHRDDDLFDRAYAYIKEYY